MIEKDTSYAYGSIVTTSGWRHFLYIIVKVYLEAFSTASISLSSTAIVIKRWQDNSMLSSSLGQSVLGILLSLNILVAIQIPLGNLKSIRLKFKLDYSVFNLVINTFI